MDWKIWRHPPPLLNLNNLPSVANYNVIFAFSLTIFIYLTSATTLTILIIFQLTHHTMLIVIILYLEYNFQETKMDHPIKIL